MTEQHEILAVLEDAIETGAFQGYIRRGGAFSAGTRTGMQPSTIARFRDKFRAVLAELPGDAMVCEVLDALDH